MSKKDARFSPHTIYKNKDGKRVPGVTTALGELNKPFLVRWANQLGLKGIDSTIYVDEAASAGRLAHAMILDDLRGIKPDLKEFTQYEIDAAENSFIKYLDWKKRHTIEPILTEMPFVSEAYQFGGTPDCYGFLDDRLTLLDFKTSKAIYDEHWIQVAAYRALLSEAGHDCDEVRILQIGRTDTGDYEEKFKTVTLVEFEIFLHALAIYQAKKRLKGDN